MSIEVSFNGEKGGGGGRGSEKNTAAKYFEWKF